ncbi:MAG: hypothetical protein KDA60_08075, partial [Planctomycetales bacterium]|nr:hypothetical protein [Planctomycetales bacterium]
MTRKWHCLSFAICLLLAACVGCRNSSSPQVAQIEQITTAYQEATTAEQYALVAQEYERLVGEAGESGGLYYNMGNAYLQSGDVGRAIAAYRKAQRYWPRNQSLAGNLAIAQRNVDSPLAPISTGWSLESAIGRTPWVSVRELCVFFTLV